MLVLFVCLFVLFVFVLFVCLFTFYDQQIPEQRGRGVVDEIVQSDKRANRLFQVDFCIFIEAQIRHDFNQI